MNHLPNVGPNDPSAHGAKDPKSGKDICPQIVRIREVTRGMSQIIDTAEFYRYPVGWVLTYLVRDPAGPDQVTVGLGTVAGPSTVDGNGDTLIPITSEHASRSQPPATVRQADVVRVVAGRQFIGRHLSRRTLPGIAVGHQRPGRHRRAVEPVAETVPAQNAS